MPGKRFIFELIVMIVRIKGALDVFAYVVLRPNLDTSVLSVLPLHIAHGSIRIEIA